MKNEFLMKGVKITKYLTVILLILSCKLSAEYVEFSNRHYGDPTSNLGGYLSIKDSEGNIDIIVSGDEVEVIVGETYTISTHAEYLQGEKHIMWNEEATEFRLIMIDYEIDHNDIINGISAYFDFQHEVSNSSSPSIKIKDPWYVGDDGTQSGEDWVEFNITYQIFLNRNIYFFETDPIYTIKAPQYYADTEGIYEFTHWEGEDIHFDAIGSTTTTSRETDVVFMSGGATITANYTQINTLSGMYILDINEELVIPPGADIQFAENFKFKINGAFNIGDIDDEVTRLSCASGVYCSPFDVTQLGRISMENVHLEHTGGVRFNYDYDYGNFEGQPEDKVYLDQVTFENINGNSIYSTISPYSFEEIGLSDCRFVIKNCVISSNIQISTWYSELIFSGNSFSDNLLQIHNSNNVNINNNYFDGTQILMNGFSGNINEGSLYIYYNLFDLTQNNSCFIRLTDFNFDPNSYIVSIHDNTFVGQVDYSPNSMLTVTDNSVLSDVTLVIKNNLFVSDINGTSVSYYAIEVPEFDGLEYSIGFNNFWAFDTPYHPSGVGENDIFVNPLLVDPGNEDFTLQCTSPCIDTGDPSLPLDPDGTTSDIGYYYFDQSQLWSLHISGEVGEHPVLSWDVCCMNNYLQNQIWRYYLDLNTDGNLIANSNTGSWIDTDYVISRIDEEEGFTTIRVQRVKSPTTGYHQRVNYKVKQEDTVGRTCPYSNEVYTYRLLPGPITKETSSIPTLFALHANYPNPFNPITTIAFDIPKECYVTLTIYDVTGKVVKKLINERVKAGTYKVIWNASKYASGVYFLNLTSGNYSKTKKIILLK